MSGKGATWTARGTGKCPNANCTFTYSTFRKSDRCPECNYFLGGKFVEKPSTSSEKRRKLDNPPSVLVCSFNNNTLYSMKVNRQDDRTFCLVSVSNRMCYYKSCRDFRALSVASGEEMLKKFSCSHLDKVRESVSSKEEYCLSDELVSNYPGGADVTEKMAAAWEYAKQLGIPQVIQVSESTYAVCGLPDTSAEMGFVYVKNKNGSLLCSVTHYITLSGGKQLKARHVCLRIHLLSCCLGLWKSPSPSATTSTSVSPGSSADTSLNATQVSSVSRTSTLKLNLATHYPYHIPLHVISAARTADCRGWPKEFTPVDVTFRLCGSGLHPPRCHPGSQGKAVLVTNNNPFLPVVVKVKMCQNADCQAMHQPQVYEMGNYCGHHFFFFLLF